MKTFQGFILWGHASKYIEEILKIIRDYPNIQIKKILKKENIDIKKFIDHIYALDDYPKEHISAKTKYLLTCPNEVYLIIVYDKNTIYKQKDNKHKYAYNETFLKWKIRLLYNPRSKDIDVNKLITKENIEKASIQKFWIPEITQNHVIHSSDSEEEFAHILLQFNLKLKKSKDYLHNKIIHDFPVIDVSINNLLANTCEKQGINLENTPHYQYLLGQKEQYKNYILKYLGLIIKDDHLPDKYNQLINNFEYGKLIENKPSFIIVKKNNNNLVIIDGVHRACILKWKGIDSIKVYLDQS